MGEVDLRALNLSYQQVRVLLGESPIGRVVKGDNAYWRCGWKDCDWTLSVVVEESAKRLGWPIALVDHVFTEQHYGLNTDR